MKKEESWIFDLFCEILSVVITWAIIIWAGITIGLFDAILYPAIGAPVFILTLWMFFGFVLRKPIKCVRLRLPRTECKGTVSEKRMRPQNLFCREWIIFNAEDGQQTRIYIPYIRFRTEDKRMYKNLTLLASGDTGTLHYRKGKKYNYFEAFDLDS